MSLQSLCAEAQIPGYLEYGSLWSGGFQKGDRVRVAEVISGSTLILLYSYNKGDLDMQTATTDTVVHRKDGRRKHKGSHLQVKKRTLHRKLNTEIP